ncbi:response regulator [Labilibaculum sp. A4]|uniref:response regulator transcription factor n=1 Tax=Labilibaculum euxinus TaxID=2686357 RepID=UPI000F617B9F|nr:response regulator transcription factor [Labilibaculum euxinus]MDQ1769328.1 response regulator transcription factor [Labilibaculum euxinus]MWN74853.1 response regulator [Labilibaculum euxinus]
MKILIIEDELELQGIISNYLNQEKYICESADNFRKADEKLSIYQYDVILLDIGLPDGNGLNLLSTIKKHQLKGGVIIISAKNSTGDKIAGLDLGADDYMTKPFELSELNSRIRAVIRRRQMNGDNIIVFNEISINTNSKTVLVDHKEIAFTKKEYDLLLFFLINKNRVLTKEVLADHLWEDNIDLAVSFDFIYTHLNNIRKKIRSAGGCDYIKTIYGMGYKFTDL